MRLERDGTVELARLGKIGEVEPLQRREALRDILLSGCDARQRGASLPLAMPRIVAFCGYSARIWSAMVCSCPARSPLPSPAGPFRFFAPDQQSNGGGRSEKLTPSEQYRHHALLRARAL